MNYLYRNIINCLLSKLKCKGEECPFNVDVYLERQTYQSGKKEKKLSMQRGSRAYWCYRIVIDMVF